MSADAFGIYVHWPFCAAKCPYCDFNSHVRRDVDAMRYARGLTRELKTLSVTMDRAPEVTSIFFGGGTPSLMPGAAVDLVLKEIAGAFPVADDVEITLEANPTSVDAERFRDYRAAGINRLSMGVQSLNDADLKALGRWHTAEEAMAAFAIARETFPRISFDLIYARTGQTVEAWREELGRALDVAVDHLSLYQLTLEDGTPFKALADLGKLKVPDDEAAVALYEATQELCDAKGMQAYEISNHAREGAESRHNLLYWRYGNYLGIGPGAHGRLTIDEEKIATYSRKSPEEWLTAVEKDGTGLQIWDAVKPEDQAREMLLMGLRLSEGIDPARYRRLNGKPLDEKRVAILVRDGFLEERGDRLAATARGRLVLNAVIATLAD